MHPDHQLLNSPERFPSSSPCIPHTQFHDPFTQRQSSTPPFLYATPITIFVYPPSPVAQTPHSSPSQPFTRRPSPPITNPSSCIPITRPLNFLTRPPSLPSCFPHHHPLPTLTFFLHPHHQPHNSLTRPHYQSSPPFTRRPLPNCGCRLCSAPL